MNTPETASLRAKRSMPPRCAACCRIAPLSLFVDRAEIEPKPVGPAPWYLFQAKDPFFEGHFPGYPLVPGVVILECMAQAGRLLLNARAGGLRPGFLVGVDGAKFNHKVHPGDLLRVETRLTRATGDGAMDVKARSTASDVQPT